MRRSGLVGVLALSLHACASQSAGTAPAPRSVIEPPSSEAPPAVDIEELRRLALKRDPKGVELCIEALRDEREEARLVAAQALAEYGPALAGRARGPLRSALARAEPELAPSLAWALVVFAEQRELEGILPLMAERAFSTVRRLDGSPAFDPLRLHAFGAGLVEKEARAKYLRAVADGVGGAPLVAELETLPEDPKAAWYARLQIFKLIDELADPRAADALARYASNKPHVHFETRAAFALAQVGDLRAVPYLARRLRMNPLKVYADEHEWEIALKRDDTERVISARLLADLSALHPEAHATLREQAEDALIFWIHELPSPHANGLRALAAMSSTKDIRSLRAWASPRAPLPKEGQQPPMPEEWIIAQSALRYVGRTKDAPSWGALLKSLQRRPAKFDSSMDGLMRGGGAILGMSLRALGVGAANGLAEWGDSRAFSPLLRYAEDPLNNEHARLAACEALPWVGGPAEVARLPDLVLGYDGNDQAQEFSRGCILSGLVERSIPGLAPKLMPLLSDSVDLETRRQVARAIAASGIDATTEAALLAKLSGNQRIDVALALILGGSPPAAKQAVSAFQDRHLAERDELAEAWFRSFNFWSEEDLENGALFRVVENADAIAEVSIAGERQTWGRAMLWRQLQNVTFDNGPRSLTRPVFVQRLFRLAKSGQEPGQEHAVRALALLGARGTLLALCDEPGRVGELARDALAALRELPRSNVSFPSDY